MRSPAVTTRGEPGETYADFERRSAGNRTRVEKKCAALDKFVPCCRSCGETCEPSEAGTRCLENNIPMHSRWARELAHVEFYRLGNFAMGGWHSEADRLACLLDRVRAGAEDGESDARDEEGRP